LPARFASRSTVHDLKVIPQILDRGLRNSPFGRGSVPSELAVLITSATGAFGSQRKSVK
jgi:hypothetical protein